MQCIIILHTISQFQNMHHLALLVLSSEAFYKELQNSLLHTQANENEEPVHHGL